MMDSYSVITRNAAQCRKCEDIIESTHRHDFVWCKCQSIAVDGGKAYIRRVGDPTAILELSEFKEVTSKRNNDAYLCGND